VALDTVSKRFSAIHLGSPWRGLLPIPDATIDQGDRQQLMFLCSAILAGEAGLDATPTDGGALTFRTLVGVLPSNRSTTSVMPER
jgi:hypothetical protein